MLLIFIFSLYIIVSVSCCINNNLKILVAYNKQVDWAQSMSHCGSVGQLGQACSCAWQWHGICFFLTTSPKCQYLYILSTLFEPCTYKLAAHLPKHFFEYEFPSCRSELFVLYEPYLLGIVFQSIQLCFHGKKKTFSFLVHVRCRSVT